jgi:hypothetical protein
MHPSPLPCRLYSSNYVSLGRIPPQKKQHTSQAMRSSSRYAWASAVLAVALLLCLCATVNSRPLLAARDDSVKCGDPPEHCKPKDAACTLRTVSECIPPYKCRGGKCSEPLSDKAQGSTTAPAKELSSTDEGDEEAAPKDAPSGDTTAPSCGDPPEHCKPKGAECKPGKVSECVKGLRCDKGTHKCVDKAPVSDKLPAKSPDDSEVQSDDNDEEVPADDEVSTETEPVQDSSMSSSASSTARASSSASTNRGGTAISSSQATSGR